MARDLSKLKRPYYLNRCGCGKIGSCKICMSKYQRKARLALTSEDRAQINTVSRSFYENRSPEAIEIQRQKYSEYWHNLSDEQREIRKARNRRNWQKKKWGVGMTFTPGPSLMKKAQGMMSRGRYVQSIDLEIPEELDSLGEPRCRVIFLDTITGETGCTYIKINEYPPGVSGKHGSKQ